MQVTDLDGDGLYAVLGVHQKAPNDELRKVSALANPNRSK